MRVASLPRSKPRPVRTSMLVAAALAGACAAEPCPPEDACEPLLVVRAYPSMGFPDGNYQISIDVDGETTECTSVLPNELEDVTDCGDFRVTYRRETVCEQSERDDNLSVRCSDVGRWRQSIWIDSGPETVTVREVFPDGSEVEETLSPEYEPADPYRVNCSECPRAEVQMDLP